VVLRFGVVDLGEGGLELPGDVLLSALCHTGFYR
jgi:hypothetical protein